VNICHNFAEELSSLVDKYRDEGISVAEVIGALECEKMEIYLDARESDE
jgi:hypothetical protein